MSSPRVTACKKGRSDGAFLGAGAIIMGTKTKSYWLTINYHEADARDHSYSVLISRNTMT